MRKFLKNIEARVLPYSVLILMIVAGLTTMFFVLPPHELTVSAATTDQFSYYKQITLNSSQVPSTLTNFPVLINITDTDLRDNCLSSGWDIAFFSATDIQLNHEIELYNGTTGQLVAWVNVTSLAHDADTIMYMYYGDADIGASAENVAGTWDANFVGVWHLKDITTSTVKDSTGYLNNGTKKGANEPNQVDAKISKGQSFDGTDDYIGCGRDNELNITGDEICISLWIKPDVTTGTRRIVGMPASGSGGTIAYNLHIDTKRILGVIDSDQITYGAKTWEDTTNYTHIGFRYDGSNMYLYKDGVQVNSTAKAGNIPANTNDDFYIGRFSASFPQCYDGIIDEVRVSNIARSADWMLTEYNNMNNDTSGGFFTIGSQQDATTGEYEISGLNAQTRFPFSGEADETVWSTGNITMNIYTNVSLVSDNCTDIFIDFADIDADIVQENFSLAIINTTDGNWATISSVLQVSAVDGNMTFNATTWATGLGAGWAHGTNPFPIVGYNSTLAVRVCVSIPAGKATGTYTTDSWKVLWKVII